MRSVGLVALACALVSTAANADDTPSPIWDPPKPQKLLTPDARKFLAPGPFSYWAGTERVADGELSIATPRAAEGDGFLPPLDDHLSTTTYLRGTTAVVRGARDVNVLELSSLHDIQGGAVLGVAFRLDARDQTAAQGNVTAALPLPSRSRWWLVPSIGVGAGADFASVVIGGAEVRSDRSKPLGYSFGVEGSGWSRDRARVLGSAAVIGRVGRGVALEERIALGAWAGPDVGGELALRWTSAALQNVGTRAALYERVTFARGPGLEADLKQSTAAASSLDIALGFRHSIGASYGVALQLDEGAREGAYQRWGGELTLYGVLF